MAAFRYTMIFQYISGAQIGGALNLKGGFSESVYAPSGPTANLALFKQFALRRAALLPTGSYISGLRVQQVDPSGAAQTYSVNYQGGVSAGAFASDIPQMALLLRVRSGSTNNVRSMRLAAIPDSMVVNGEYSPSGLFPVAMSTYLDYLSGWRMRVQDLSQPLSRIKSIDAGGNAVMLDAYTGASGSVVKVKRTVDSFGNQKGGKFTVGTVTDPLHLQILNWTLGVCVGGMLQPFVIIYPEIAADNTSISRVVVRKIGRPLLGYRGRRSKRKP